MFQGRSSGTVASPVGPNRGIVPTHGTSINRDAPGGTPATQAVAHIKRGQGADREAPVAAVVNREIGDGVGATRHETRRVKRIGNAKPRDIRIENGKIGCLCRRRETDRCICQTRVCRIDRAHNLFDHGRARPCVDDPQIDGE